MPDDIRIEAHIPVDLDEALDRLASARGQSKSALVRDALSEFVMSEDAFVAAVNEGLADLDRGDTIPHAEVMQEIDAFLARKR
jgi:predicted transcriptional regulator